MRPTTVFGSNKPHLAARGHGIYDIRAIQELRLKFPGLSAVWWIGEKHATGRQPIDIAGLPAASTLPRCMTLTWPQRSASSR